MTQNHHRKSHALTDAQPAAPGWRAFLQTNRGWMIAGAGAAGLAGAALFNRASTRRAEEACPPIGDFVQVDGVRLHYVDRGTGPAVVFLHGNGVLLQDFEVSGVLDRNTVRHRTIAFDRPGFGYSDRPRSTVWTPAAQAALIAKALNQLGVESAVVVGHSWGTMVALAMALDHSETVAGLVLLSGYYYGTARPDVFPASIPAIPLLGDLIAHTSAPLTGLLSGPLGVKASFSPAPVSNKFADFPVAMTLRPSQIRAAAADTAMMIPAGIALSQRYAELDLPVIVMAGDRDLIAHPNKHAQRLVHDIAGADLRMIAGQGHLLHYAVPEQVVAAIDDVIAQAG